MAQLNITLNQEEILLLLSENRDDAFKKLLQESLNSILKAESKEQLKAEPYERSEDRQDVRNGSRERQLTTRIGTFTLVVPRHRNQPFKTMVFDNYRRSEAALVATMAEMVVNGVSTRKVAKVMEVLCETTFSKSAVSEVCKDLDTDVKEFRERPLTEKYPFVMFDATYFKVREDHRILSKAMLIALGTRLDGTREVIGFAVYDGENNTSWTDFLLSLRQRGLNDPDLFTSDAHESIRYAIGKVFPGCAWQRCQTHFSRNIMDAAPKKYAEGIHVALLDMYHSKTVEEARKKRDAIMDEYSEVAEKAMDILDEGFEDAMTVMALPESMRRFFRTNNHLERLNRELKRRSKVIGVFPNRESVLRLMGSALLELNENLLFVKRANYHKADVAALPACREVLREIAMEQRKLSVA